MKKYKKIIIGIDQSYKNTGVSICADGNLKKITSIHLEKCNNNSERRSILSTKLLKLFEQTTKRAEEVICIIERIRLRSQGFININYIKSIGALDSVIIDVCHNFDIPVYSVDTRCWKATVVGTSKKMSNKYGVPEEKWPTVKWVISQGFKNSIIEEITGKKTKGTFVKNNKRYRFNDDAADSAAIAVFGFIGDKLKLKEEH